MYFGKKSFTLVEIITAVVIIIILSLAWFFLAWKMMKDWRDAQRYADANTLAISLESYFFNYKDYPDPSDKIQILDQSGTLLWYQWVADKQVISNWLNITKIPVDPSNKNLYYTYLKAINQTTDQKGYEVSTMIESFLKKDEWYKMYKWKYLTPYIINSNTIDSCNNEDELIYPTKLTVMNYKTNEFLKESNLWEWVSVVLDMENLKWSCESEIVAPILWFSWWKARIDTGSITLLEVESYPDLVCDCSWIEHALSCYQIYDGEKYSTCHVTQCEDWYYLWWWYCVLGTGYLDTPVPYKNYWYKSVFIDSVWCDAKTSSLWWSNYKINIWLSNACGEDTYIWVSTPARAWNKTNYWGDRTLLMWWPTIIWCSEQSRYCWRTLIRVPVERIFAKWENLTYTALHLYDYGSRQCWSSTFYYDFYESQAWTEAGATYYSNNNKTVGGVLWTITVPGWNSNVCKSNIPSWTHRSTSLSNSLFQSRANKTKTNNGLYSKLRVSCKDFSSRNFTSSEYIVKSYRPAFEFNYIGNIIKFTWDYTSSLIDMWNTYNYLNAKVDFYIPNWIDFDFYIRAGNSTTPWDSKWTDWYSFKDPKWVFQNERWIWVLSGNRYFQYRLKYDTLNIWTTPTYSYLRIYYSN